ncbi:MAG: hypothetical protein HOV77_16770 [Hamadaea sp.]|uniref:hypothetical protein n=1 Tax=Hamadaea sp. TaxID=2024425 RepID=UPI001857D415|nr:hypothetical protein [Hamadaea sp.]NUT20835.1 hypothetical protein [Hamadaea sp.]
MNTRPLISIAAVLAGLGAGVILTVSTDALLEHVGLLPRGPHTVFGLHLLEVAYRSIYAVIGGYVTARFAPVHPIRHSVALGLISLALNVVGAVATWQLNLAPAWFTLALVVFALPLAWCGGRLHRTRRPAVVTT